MRDKQDEIDHWEFENQMFWIFKVGPLYDTFEYYLTDSVDVYPKPIRPEDFSGETFATSQSLGGYGSTSSGMYTVETSTKSGYKPFGAAGQGAAANYSIAFDESD